MRIKALFSFKAKVMEPCSRLLNNFKLKFKKPSVSLRAPTFHIRRHRVRSHVRTRVVRFRKPFSIKSLGFSKFRPKTKLRSRTSSKFKRAFRFRPSRPRSRLAKKPVPKVRIAELLTVLFSLRKAKDIDTDSSVCDQVTADVSVSMSERGNGNGNGNGREPFPSPITPAYLRNNDAIKTDSSDDLEDVEDACRSFENYMVEMIVEEGKLKDLMDVEELLYCWKNLKNPIFMDLVCRFYGELCKDLFSPSEEDESQEISTTE